MDAGDSSLRLVPHSRVAIIGGGPAGSFFALDVLHLAAQLGLALEVTIFERKDLTAVGPRGCNMCAGILSHRVVKGLALLGITLPPEVILGHVHTYRLHWRRNSLVIRPPDPSREVLSVYRAGGPRNSPYAPTAGLDEFLLRQAIERGAQVIHERVDQVAFDPRPVVRTAAREERFDLVVLAIGVNASPPALPNLMYEQPVTETMAQDALLIESDAGRAQMDSTVHVYFDQPRNLIFGALVPKGPFATISLLGQHLQKDSLKQLLNVPEVLQVVGATPPQMCGCRPRVAVGIAKGYYADRFVAIGDSCVTRLYKDGIGSAFVTAHAAAETALFHGIHRGAFNQRYAPVCRAIATDNLAGRIVFSLIARSKRSMFFMRAVAHNLQFEQEFNVQDRMFSRTLWALFTGDADYSEILKMLLNPRTLVNLGKTMLLELTHIGSGERSDLMPSPNKTILASSADKDRQD